MIPRALFTDTFKIIKTEQNITASGRVNHKVSVICVGNKGKFAPLSGSRSREFLGSISEESVMLYTDYNCEIKFGRIIEDECTEIQYDVTRVDDKKFYAGHHHMQIVLTRRKAKIE